MPKLVIKNQNIKKDNLEAIGFSVTDLNNKHGIRLSAEDATHGIPIRFNNSDKQYIDILTNIDSYHGVFNLDLPEESSQLAISIFFKIENLNSVNEYELTNMLSGVVNIVEDIDTDLDISVSPSFIGPKDTASISVNGSASEKYVVSINDRLFNVRTDGKGYGSVSVSGKDISTKNSKVLQKLNIKYYSASDNFTKAKNSSSHIHIMNENVALFSDCDISDPDSICLQATKENPPPLVKELALPTRNVKTSPLSGIGNNCQVVDTNLNCAICSIYDYESTLLGNNHVLTAVSGLSTDTNSDDKYSKVHLYVEDPTSLDRVYFHKFGTVPPSLNNVQIYVDKETYDLADYGWQITINDDVFNNELFVIEDKLEPDSNVDSYRFVLDKEANVPEWLTCVPFVLAEPSGCTPLTKFPSSLTKIGCVANGVVLPIIKNKTNIPVHANNISITSKAKFKDRQEINHVYIVAEAFVGGLSQLFLYSLEVAIGSTCFIPELSDNPTYGWTQLTYRGENKNPKIELDGANNLHVFWESDRSGITQVYYSVIGPSSFSINNSTLMSSIDKHAELLSRDEKPENYIQSQLININTPTAIDIDKNCNQVEYNPNTAWLSYVDSEFENNTIIDNNNKIRITGNPVDGQCMAFTTLDQDESGNSLDSTFDQQAFSISFNISDKSDQDVLTDNDIDTLWDSWKIGYTAVVDQDFHNSTLYKKSDNKFRLYKGERYFDRFIPIVGSYKNDNLSSNFSNCEIEITDEFEVVVQGSGANLNHFMIGLMPEKVRFKATNVQTVEAFCEERGTSLTECINAYLNDEELLIYTGRYTLAAVINADTNYVGSSNNARYRLVRNISDPFSLDTGVDIKILSHYRKMYKEDNELWLGPTYDNSGSLGNSEEKRVLSSLTIDIDGQIKYSESFLVDVNDEFSSFDIGLGFPGGGRYITNDFKPYETFVYENMNVDFQFTDVFIGKPSVSVDVSTVSMPDSYRNFNIMSKSSEKDISTSEEYFESFDYLSLGVEDFGFAEIPITFEGINKSISRDKGFSCNDIHIAWEGNADKYWNIFYSSITDRAVPFKFNTKITDTESNSISPDIAVDPDGDRIITWQDNRYGSYQIFAAKGNAGSSTVNPTTCGSRGRILSANCYEPGGSCDIEFEFCYTPCHTSEGKTLEEIIEEAVQGSSSSSTSSSTSSSNSSDSSSSSSENSRSSFSSTSSSSSSSSSVESSFSSSSSSSSSDLSSSSSSRSSSSSSSVGSNYSSSSSSISTSSSSSSIESSYSSSSSSSSSQSSSRSSSSSNSSSSSSSRSSSSMDSSFSSSSSSTSLDSSSSSSYQFGS